MEPDVASISLVGAQQPMDIQLLVDTSHGLIAALLRSMEDIDISAWCPIPLAQLGDYHPYDTIGKLEIAASDLSWASRYECPYLRSTHRSVVPTFLLTQVPALYPAIESCLWRREITDAAWMREMHWNAGGMDDLDAFQRVLLGPGYTDGFRPSDGSRCVRQAHIAMSNGDALVVAVWDWRNN